MAATTGLTIEDFENLPDALAVNHELVDGKLVDVSGNVLEHILLRDYLTSLVGDFARKDRLGVALSEMEYKFGENAHGPDVSFVREHRKHLLERGRRVQLLVPDLAIEVASPNDRYPALRAKLQRYLEFGTEEA